VDKVAATECQEDSAGIGIRNHAQVMVPDMATAADETRAEIERNKRRIK